VISEYCCYNVTKAATYEELTGRVREIAPALYVMNGLGSNPARISLSFNQEQSYSDRIAFWTLGIGMGSVHPTGWTHASCSPPSFLPRSARLFSTT